ncbi:hypothetical protein [Actinoalloteichus hymeniacidonis]|uniref:Uncharacterized protein n=1 Tax=Actinoalloteichus hymeniacidonis TaxID=340345 RepID=A0AAC9N0K7_9PSEU|nr:hypothetical protein [Actinoalloteichus hymeniacidonis]AOS65192.1 hypothetical protein TL08_22040 [Actinoalloteichus hymeniacidonis]MBB5906728.1 hypothetical protein [Actinoalloteichus hymeniacidonis]
MPIRTNRGRAAVYRRLWGWPMRSPRHLVVTLVLFVLLVTGLGYILPEQEESAASPTDETSTVETDASAATTGPSVEGSAESGEPQPPTSDEWEDAAPPDIELTETDLPTPPEEDGIEVAREWGAAWLSFDETADSEEWLARLEPFTTEERLAVMSSVDPQNIPFDEITSDPELVDSGDSTMTVLLPTDVEPLELILIVREGQWRVSAYNQVSA